MKCGVAPCTIARVQWPFGAHDRWIAAKIGPTSPQHTCNDDSPSVSPRRSSAAATWARFLPDRNSTKDRQSGYGPADRIHHRLDSVDLMRPRKTYRHPDCPSESLIDLWWSTTAVPPAHIDGSGTLGAFPDPLALSGNMFSTNAGRISEFQTRRPGCSQCVPVGRIV